MLPEIANHLWQSTLFAVLVGVLCHWLRNDAAHIRYWLWWSASVKFLVPFALLTSIAAWLADTASVVLVPEAWTSTMTVVARPFAAEAGAWSPGAVLLAVWAAGSLVALGSWVVRAARLRRVLTRAERDPSPLVDGRRRIGVLRTEARVEPGIVGLLQTRLLLPARLEARLTRAQLEAVLAHELCHVRRRDNLTAAVHMLVEAVFWFHPLIWWIGARLVDERERACDEMVVALGHDRETYAESIINVCEHYAASPLRCAAGISGSDLQRRITRIMRYPGMKNLRLAKKMLLGAVAAGSFAIPVIAGLALQRAAVAQSPPGIDVDEDGEFLPIVKVAPVYPPHALDRGLEGYVIVEYTITEAGTTENFEAVESTSKLFESAAIESARKYKFRPRVVNAQPVAVHGVQTKIAFEIEGGDIDLDPAGPAPSEEDARDNGDADGVTVTGRPPADDRAR